MLYRLFVIILLSIASAGFLSGCANETDLHREEHTESENVDAVKLTEASVKQIGLQTEVVSLKPFIGFLSIPATVLVNQDKEAQVGSLVQGRVSKVFVKAGDYVKKGDELMQVEGLEVGEIKAAFLTAKANLDYYKENYERQKSLNEQKAGSLKSYHEARSEYEKSLAVYNAEDKKIHSIGLEDDDIINVNTSDEHTSGKLSVKSPINGVVVERNVVIGQLVDGTTNAFRIIDISSVWIDGQLYEKDLNKINERTNAVFTVASSADKFNGKVSYIGQTIDENSRTVTIRGEFNNPEGKLKPQMFGEMQLPVGAKYSAVLIPAESVIKIANADYVFVKNGSEFVKRAVITGVSQDNLIEIKEGLTKNEIVVTKGAFFLKSELLKGELEEDEH